MEDRIYYLSIRGNDMNCITTDFYFLCYIVYGLSNIDWIDTANIKIEYLGGDNKFDKGFIDPEECYNYFVEEIRYM